MPLGDKLESRRRSILARLAQIRALRRGSLNRRFNVCGKPICRCKANPPRPHGPYFFITTKVYGKTRCRYIEDRRQVPLLRRQLEAHQRFRQWVKDFVAVCEQIADRELLQRKGVGK